MSLDTETVLLNIFCSLESKKSLSSVQFNIFGGIMAVICMNMGGTMNQIWGHKFKDVRSWMSMYT